MADQLAGIRGAFVMSINDRPEIREIFGRFIVDEVRLTYTVASGEGTKARELIISNHEAPAGAVVRAVVSVALSEARLRVKPVILFHRAIPTWANCNTGVPAFKIEI